MVNKGPNSEKAKTEIEKSPDPLLEEAQLLRELIGNGSAREGQGRGKIKLQSALITRGSGNAGARHDSTIKICIVRASSTP